MQIRRFFSPDLTQDAENLVLSPQESNHALRVLRLQPGDRLQLLNGRGLIADAELLPAGDVRRPKEASCRILSRKFFAPKAPSLTLCVAPPRGKAFDLVLKASVELGFAAIQPILCTYGVSRPEEASDNWQETLVTALKQSSNPYLPEILPPRSFSEILEASRTDISVFGASPAAEATPHQPLTPTRAAATTRLWIGPEGGFTQQEEQALLDHAAIPITLGHCILRVETAVPALAGCLYGLAGMDDRNGSDGNDGSDGRNGSDGSDGNDGSEDSDGRNG